VPRTCRDRSTSGCRRMSLQELPNITMPRRTHIKRNSSAKPAFESDGATYVYQEALNANPEALLFLTPNWNPGQPVSGYGGYLNHNLLVAFNGTRAWIN